LSVPLVALELLLELLLAALAAVCALTPDTGVDIDSILDEFLLHHFEPLML
jgi:hypothetical protein